MGDTVQTLAVLTRYPVPGRVKTRLVPALGEEGAARLQWEMSRLTVQVARQARKVVGCTVEVHHDGGDEAAMKRWLGQDVLLFPQVPGHLGRRLHAVTAGALERNAGPVAAIGSDCPDLHVDHLVQAFEMLRSHDVVLGPARDGGYYLVGLRRPTPQIFEGIPWSTDQVLRITLDIARGASLGVHLLEELADVDRPEDL